MTAPPRARVHLRPLSPDDAPATSGWLPEAVAAVDGLRPTPATPTELRVIAEWVAERWPAADLLGFDAEDRGLTGFIAWDIAGEALTIRALAVRRDARNLGYGLEAVQRIEERHPDNRYFAAIPRYNGLAVYFWLRAGYRPVRLDEAERLARDPDHLWMRRAANLIPPA